MSHRPHFPLVLLNALSIIVVVLLVWSPSYWNGFVWDDHVLIEKNDTHLAALSVPRAFLSDFWSTQTEAGRSNYYRPLVTLSYMFDYAVHGMNAYGFHITNVVIHALGAVSLWWVLILVGVPAGAASLGVVGWALHPAMAESVAWISGRTDTLATLFVLLSIISSLRACSSKHVDNRWLAISAFFFGAGLLSKESAIVAPVLIALFVSLRARGSLPIKSFILCFGGVASLWFLIRSLVLARPFGTDAGEGVSQWIGALSLFHIWGNLVWPPLFRIEYGASLTPAALLAGSVMGAGLVLGLLYAITARRVSRTVCALYVAAFVSFLPSIMAALLKSMIGARLIYMSAAFAVPAIFIVVIGQGASRRRRAAVIAACVILGLYSAHRATLWRSDQALFTNALDAPDASTRNHLNLGIALYNDGELRAALEHLNVEMESAALDQKHYMLALLYTAISCERLAEEHLNASIAAKPANYSAYHNLAGLFASQGRLDEARGRLQYVVTHYPEFGAQSLRQLKLIEAMPRRDRRDPHDFPWCTDNIALEDLLASAPTLNRMGGEHLKTGQLELGEVLIRAALKVDPWLVGARLNMAQVHILKNEPARARETLEAILLVNPGEARALTLLQALNERSKR